MHVAVLSLELDLPDCRTLKHKRSSLKSLLIALQREFSCSAAELDRLDAPSAAVIGCALLTNDGRHGQRVLEKIPPWIERHRPDVVVVDHAIELR
jgi:uncharacterized protein YlxP (DUF503 family)